MKNTPQVIATLKALTANHHTIEVWDNALVRCADGLDLTDSDDRGIFRFALSEALKNTKLHIVEHWLNARMPDLKVPRDRYKAIRLMADVFIKNPSIINEPVVQQTKTKTKTEKVLGTVDITHKLSKPLRDAGFTLIQTAYANTESNATNYQYELKKNGEYLRYGKDVLVPKTLQQAEKMARQFIS